jgi:chromosomal replication initiation ATPase DnaA
MPNCPKCIEEEQVNEFTDHVKKCLCRELRIEQEKMEVKNRQRERVLARMFLYGYLRIKFPEITLSRMAKTIGYSPDHTTVLNMLKQLCNLLTDPCQRGEAELYRRLKGELFGQ